MVLQKDTQLPESVPETTSMASIRFVWTLALIAAFTHAGIAGDNDPPVVQTKYGQLSGKVVNTQKGSCDVFLGVPYAAPPIGDLRWQKPQDPTQWPNIRNATEFGPKCIQAGSNGTAMDESEDCLSMNIFVPRGAGSKNLPVMLFIHGGGYLVSSAREYGDTGPCENLASRGVIIAIIQYRLGIYGFFSTGDSVAPGNYGMWDQIAALKWVKDNIENFGGDHAKVTVFGESAGASSVSYLTYTPAAKELFQQSIAESGSAFSNWAAMSDVSVTAATELAQGARCTSQDSAEYMSCLRQLTTGQLQQVANTVPFFGTWFPAIRVDGDLFMQGTLQDLGTKRPAIIGVNSIETPIPNVNDVPKANALLNSTLEGAIVENDTALADVLTQTARYVYIDSKGDRNDLFFVYEQQIKIQVDLGFGAAAAHEATLKADAGDPIWVYNFEYYSDNVFKPDFPFEKGAPHGHELCYLFLLPPSPAVAKKPVTCPTNYEGDSGRIAEYMGEMWTNFAKFGDPSPKGKIWPRFHSLTNASAMVVNVDLRVEATYHLDVTNFWYYLKPNIEQVFANMAKNTSSNGDCCGSGSAGITANLNMLIFATSLFFVIDMLG